MPYREGHPLGDLIAPDRRRQKTIALVVVGMLMGAGALYALQQVTKDVPTVHDDPPKAFSATLTGPDGSFTIPVPGKRTVVHVWLQACSDCMPAFEAMRNIDDDLAPNVVNVSYGTADPSWAAQYGVRRNLVFDHGGTRVVKPLAISSFTTIVFDENGKIIGQDRPDRPGYVERVRALVDPGPLSARDIEELVSTKHESIRDRCWNLHRDIASADITVVATVGGDGRVIAAIGRGTHSGLAQCVENEVKRWRFRATGGASVQVDIPFKLRRE